MVFLYDRSLKPQILSVLQNAFISVGESDISMWAFCCIKRNKMLMFTCLQLKSMGQICNKYATSILSGFLSTCVFTLSLPGKTVRLQFEVLKYLSYEFPWQVTTCLIPELHLTAMAECDLGRFSGNTAVVIKWCFLLPFVWSMVQVLPNVTDTLSGLLRVHRFVIWELGGRLRKTLRLPLVIVSEECLKCPLRSDLLGGQQAAL